jgi:hypothetical protein
MRALAAALCTVGLVGLLAGSSTAGGIEVHLAASGRTLWVTTGSQVLRVDGASGRVLARPRPGGSYPLAVAVGGGAAWVACVENGFVAGALSRVDLATGRVTTRLRTRDGVVGDVAVGGGSAWALVGRTEAARLARVDLASGRQVALLPAGRSPSRLAADASAVWVSDAAGALLRVDPRTGRARTVLRSARLGRVTAAFGDAWAADGRTIVRVDGRAGGAVLARIPIGGAVIDVTAGPRNAWVLAFERRRVRLVRVDARANRVTAVRLLPGLPSSVAVSAGGIWVGLLGPTERLLRLDPRTLRVRASVPLL